MSFRTTVLLAAGLLLLSLLTPPLAAADPKQDPSAAAARAADPASKKVEQSVVKVFTTARYPDPYKPWTKQAPAEMTGSGVVVEGKRILTNAHVVNYASQVQVQANESGDKFTATVVAIAPGIDLALLKVDDEKFFEGHEPLPRSTALPKVKDAVLVYGFPVGGNNLSITKGIISRIEFVGYGSFTSGLRIQIDAAINPGNSGGPAVVGDRMIGLAFSHLRQSENIGYIIPSEEIELFLQDVADGKYDGKPGLYDMMQTLENPALRPFLKISDNAKGIIVSKPAESDPSYPLKTWDIITSIGGVPVDNQGMITLDDDLRIGSGYLVQKKAKDGRLPVTVVRGGKELKLDVPVRAGRPQVIGSLNGEYPSYFIFGPMVFSKATTEFMSGPMNAGMLGAFAYNGSPLINRLGDKPAFEGEELVVVSSPLFPHKLSKDYSNPAMQVVKSINGTAVKNLSHLVQLLRDSKDEFISIEFDTRPGAEIIVFNRNEALKATEEILTDNGIRSQGSPDTLKVWEKK